MSAAPAFKRAGDVRVGSAITKLAIARATHADDAILAVYLDALEDLNPSLIERACRDFARMSRAEYDTALPSVGAIRERVEQIAALYADADAKRRLMPMPKVDENDSRTWVHCRFCRDEPNAWRMYYCQGQGTEKKIGPGPLHIDMQPCARTFPHASHTYAERCQCSDTNPVIAKHREKARAYRPAAEPKRRGRSAAGGPA